jgi:hypothetical protein
MVQIARGGDAGTFGVRVLGSGFRIILGSEFRVPNYSFQVSWFKSNYLAEILSGSEEGSYSRRTDLCITQLKALE